MKPCDDLQGACDDYPACVCGRAARREAGGASVEPGALQREGAPIRAGVPAPGLIAVCSRKPRPSVHSHAKGHQFWRRDVYHLRGAAGTTLCGRDASDFIEIGPLAPDQPDHHCCTRCVAAYRALAPSPSIAVTP